MTTTELKSLPIGARVRTVEKGVILERVRERKPKELRYSGFFRVVKADGTYGHSAEYYHARRLEALGAEVNENAVFHQN